MSVWQEAGGGCVIYQHLRRLVLHAADRHTERRHFGDPESEPRRWAGPRGAPPGGSIRRLYGNTYRTLQMYNDLVIQS